VSQSHPTRCETYRSMAAWRSEVCSDAGDLPVWPDTASEDESYYADPRQRRWPMASSKAVSEESSVLSTDEGSEPARQPSLCSEGAVTAADTDVASLHSEELETPGKQRAAVARPRRGRKCAAAPAAAGPAAACGGAAVPRLIKDDITTLMVRNLPENVSQQDFVDELDRCGYAGRYDYCYAPIRSMKTRKGTGFAFVNFVAPEVAQEFAKTWHRTRRFGIPKDARYLDVSPALVQGRDANMAGAGSSRIRRIRNSNFRPLVVDSAAEAAPTAPPAAASVPPEADSSSSCFEPAPPASREEVAPRTPEPAAPATTLAASGDSAAPMRSRGCRGGPRGSSGGGGEPAIPASKGTGAGQQVIPPPPAPTAASIPSRRSRRSRRAPSAEEGEDEKEELAGEAAHVGPRALSGPPSWGSLGHPWSCGRRCKYAAKARGCKDGALCDHCHLCALLPANLFAPSSPSIEEEEKSQRSPAKADSVEGSSGEGGGLRTSLLMRS